MVIKDSLSQNQTIRKYYHFQSTIYDATRWSFLFGRKMILDKIAAECAPQMILEIGCGTGFNLKKLSKKFPAAKILGMDVSKDMLIIAQKKLQTYPNIQLLTGSYGNKPWNFTSGQPDVILFSYVLTMVNPDYASMISQAYRDLKPGGYIAVVDFHKTNHAWFRKHMGNHHVRMEGHLNRLLEKNFTPIDTEIHQAYQGVWQYFSFIGKKE